MMNDKCGENQQSKDKTLQRITRLLTKTKIWFILEFLRLGSR